MVCEKSKYYLDLINKDNIIINVGSGQKLELIVNEIREKKDIDLQIIDRVSYSKNLKKSSGIYIKRYDVAIYNFGNRHHGNRAHVRLEMPWHYSYELIRKN